MLAQPARWHVALTGCDPVPQLERPSAMIPILRRSTSLVLCVLFGTILQAGNWPQWRGPDLNGSSPETGLAERWGPSENVAWRTVLPGPAGSTPVVWGDRVFLSSTDSASKGLVAMCVDARSGDILWRHRVGDDRKALGANRMSNPSPVTDGRHVWFLYGNGIFICFDMDGTQQWRRDLEDTFGQLIVKFGYSASPLLYGNRLFITLMQNRDPYRYMKKEKKRLEAEGRALREGPLESFLMALSADDGKTLWRHVRTTDATDESVESYTTLMPFEQDGRQNVVLVCGECVTGNDMETGAENWRWWFTPRDREIWQRTVTSAVVCGDLIVAVRPKHRPIFALKVDGTGELGEDTVVWSVDKNTPDVTTPLFYRGRLYTLDGDMRTMTCLEPKTGRVIWRESLGGKAVFRASPTGADGRIYCISKGGEVVVVAAGDTFKVLSRTEMPERPCMSTIVPAGGALFVRTAKALYCIRKGGAAGQ